MVIWKPMKDIYVGAIGYVSCYVGGSNDFSSMVLCEVVGIINHEVEIVLVGSDGTCILVAKQKIHTRHH
jgi:hypothetical protein